MPQHGQTNPTDPNFYWDANFGRWQRKPGSPTGGPNLTLEQALAGVDQTQLGQDITSSLLGNPNGPLSPPGGGGLGINQAPIGTIADPDKSPGTRLRMSSPTGGAKFTGDPAEIGRLLQQGYKIIADDGSTIPVKEYRGGYLINYGGDVWLPVDTILNGQITEAQKKALEEGGYPIPGDLKVVADSGSSTGNNTGGGTTTDGGTITGGGGTSTLNASPLSGSLADMLRDLMNRSLQQGEAGQKQISDLVDLLKKNAELNAGNAAADRTKRDDLVTQLLGGDTGLNAGYNKIIGNIGQGLDPATQAALQQQAIEGPERDYQGQVEALKTTLAGRGAYGGGDTPGSLGDIVRGYSPLLTARDTTRQGLLQQNAFANQNQKNLNLSAGLSALSGKGSLLGTLGGIYNPNASADRSLSALSGALSGTGAGIESGFAGLKGAGDFANILNDTSTGSLSSLLKASLIGTGLGVFSDAAKKPGFWKMIAGFLPFGGGPSRNPSADIEAYKDFASQHGYDFSGLSDDEVRAIMNGIDLGYAPPSTSNQTTTSAGNDNKGPV